MAKKAETRRYPMSDADLKQTGDDVVSLVTRDLTDFNKRNVTNQNLTNLEAIIASFAELETDEELQGLVIDATLAKDSLGEDIRKQIRAIRNMANLAYEGKGKYNTFGFDDMANMSDNELVRLAKRVVRVATTLNGELTNQGLTQQDIANLSTAANLLDVSIDAQHKAMEDRDLATEERVTQGNILWDEITRLCSIGKALYEDEDPAKYKDYVLTQSTFQPAVATSTAQTT